MEYEQLNIEIGIGDDVILPHVASIEGVVRKIVNDQYYVSTETDFFICERTQIIKLTDEVKKKQLEKLNTEDNFPRFIPSLADSVVRFLPLPNSPDNPLWISEIRYRVADKLYSSPSEVSERCPIKDLIMDNRQKALQDNTKFKLTSVTRRYHSIVKLITSDDLSKQDDIGRNFIFTYSKGVSDILKDDFLNSGHNHSLFHPEYGRDLKIIKKEVDGPLNQKFAAFDDSHMMVKSGASTIVDELQELPKNFYKRRDLTDAELEEIKTYLG